MSTNKFKVGDKVVVYKDCIHSYMFYTSIGSIGEIIEIDATDYVKIQFSNLISNKPTQEKQFWVWIDHLKTI